MRLRNFQVDALATFLFKMKLSGKRSRMRTRMVRMLDEYLRNIVNLERNGIIEEYAMKDENGEVLLNETRTEAIIEPSRLPEFEREIEELLNEEFVIETNEANREMLLAVAEVILTCDMEFSENDAVIYDDWCEKFEEVVERYAHKED